MKAIFEGTPTVKKSGRYPPCNSTLVAVSPTFSPPVDILTFNRYSTVDPLAYANEANKDRNVVARLALARYF